jgi:hypothetical protein
VHEASRAANKRFVNLKLAIAEFIVLIVHREPDAVKHEPSGFLSDPYGAVNLPRANAVLAISDHPNGGEPFVQSERRVLKDSSDLNAELTFRMASLALPDAPLSDEANLVGATSRAHNTIRPTSINQVVQAVVGIGEINNRVV